MICVIAATVLTFPKPSPQPKSWSLIKMRRSSAMTSAGWVSLIWMLTLSAKWRQIVNRLCKMMADDILQRGRDEKKFLFKPDAFCPFRCYHWGREHLSTRCFLPPDRDVLRYTAAVESCEAIPLSSKAEGIDVKIRHFFIADDGNVIS